MKKEDIYTVKIYFIKPVDLISVVINTLIELEYETYTIGEFEKDRLLKILPQDRRNVLFISITNKQEIPRWLEYIEALQKIENTHIQIGAFVYNHIELADKEKFLLNNVSVTLFSDLSQNTIRTFKTILTIFEARGKRDHIRVKASGISEAFFTIKGLDKTVKARVLELSSTAFSCIIQKKHHDFFTPGETIAEAMLNLRGIRIRLAVKILGFSKARPNLYIFKYCRMELIENKITYSEKIPRDVKKKFHTYIKACLKEEIKQRLEEADLTDEEKKERAQKRAEELDRELTGEDMENKENTVTESSEPESRNNRENEKEPKET